MRPVNCPGATASSKTLDSLCPHEQQHLLGIPHHRDLQHKIRIENAQAIKGVHLGRGREGQPQSFVALRALVQVLKMLIHPAEVHDGSGIPAAEGVVKANKDANVFCRGVTNSMILSVVSELHAQSLYTSNIIHRKEAALEAA